MATKNVRLEELLEYLRQGRFMDALHEFYAENVTMVSPDEGTTTGFAENLAREQRFFASVKAFKTFDIGAVAVTDTHGFYENVAAWVGNDDKEHRVEQVALQQWENGKIIHERFYHDLP